MNENSDRILIKDHNRLLSIQDCFNIAWKWVKTHGPSITYCDPIEQLRCLYRSENHKNACFIGAFIPDSIYSDEMEQQSITLIIKFLEDQNILPRNTDVETLRYLQKCHDYPATEKNATAQKIKSKTILNLVKFAEEYKLQIP